jgi:8-oxo-dGTP pyrophosphatase MutT (NUDIX family)
MTVERSALDVVIGWLYRFAYTLMRGYWYIRQPTTTGVQVAVWCDGRLLVIGNSYRPEIGLPGGGLGRSESPASAAQRELLEEVGIGSEASTLRYLGRIDSEHDFSMDRCHFFELRLERHPRVVVDGREVVWAEFVDPASLADQMLHGPLAAYLLTLPHGSEHARPGIR